jgi:hypothetical protein
MDAFARSVRLIARPFADDCINLWPAVHKGTAPMERWIGLCEQGDGLLGSSGAPRRPLGGNDLHVEESVAELKSIRWV